MKIEIEFKSPDTPPEHTDEVIVCTRFDTSTGYRDGCQWFWASGDLIMRPVLGWAELPKLKERIKP